MSGRRPGPPDDGAVLGIPAPGGTRFAPVQWFDEIDSTNRYVLDEARRGAAEGLVVVAGHQLAGRGRLGRRWEAPAGANLLLSVLLRPGLAPDELHLCTTAMALAAADACATVSDVAVDLKWPNDLLVGGRKLAGILAESDGGAVVVGIGLNVSWPGADAAEPTADPTAEPTAEPDDGLDGGLDGGTGPDWLGSTTSLWQESARRPGPAELVAPLLTAAEPRVAALATTAGRRRQVAEYRRRCTTLGREVEVTMAASSWRGTAVDVTDEGHLVVAVGAGGARSLRTVAAGDVVHLRPRP